MASGLVLVETRMVLLVQVEAWMAAMACSVAALIVQMCPLLEPVSMVVKGFSVPFLLVLPLLLLLLHLPLHPSPVQFAVLPELLV